MSTKRLTDEERAVYLIGEAILRHLKQAPPGPERLAQVAVIRDVLCARLMDDEMEHVVINTAWDIPGWLEGPSSPERGTVVPFAKNRSPDDDIPF